MTADGRTVETPEGIRLFWPLSGIRFQYTGTWLKCDIACAYRTFPLYAAVLVDQMPVMRFPLEQGMNTYTILAGMDGKQHTVQIVRETQPVPDDPESEFTICALHGDGKLTKAKPAPYHIEFIGDSITCGEGTVGAPGKQEWNTLYLSPVNGYMQMLTTALGADCRIVAAGGWGVYSDWTDAREHNIPGIYEQVCGLSACGKMEYQFDWQPDLVIINLGTNDTAALRKLRDTEHHERLQAIEMEAVAFMHMVRKHNPGAYILWAYGMADQLLAGVFRFAVQRVKQEGMKRVGFLKLPVCEPAALGARAHPGVENHRKAKERILSYLKTNALIPQAPAP